MSPATPELPRHGTVLGFDFGAARIGVATGECETGTASALCIIAEPDRKRRFERIRALIDEWKPVMLLVGRPGDDPEHPMTTRCQRFANQLRGRFGLPVQMVDESYTSVQANRALHEAGVRSWLERKSTLDAHAAQIIVQTALDQAHATS